MRQIAVIFMVLMSVTMLSAQGKFTLKAAGKSFDDGEHLYNKGQYTESASNLEIVMENIKANNDERKYQLLRLKTEVMLIDIYFNHINNQRAGCKVLNAFRDNLAFVKRNNIVRAKDLFFYMEQEKAYGKFFRQCESAKHVDKNKTDFEKVFDEEFPDDED